MPASLLIGLSLVLLSLVVPTVIVYRRNRGKLSAYRSFRRGQIGFTAWGLIVLGSLMIVLTTLDVVVGTTGAPWWSPLVGVGAVASGYGVLRVRKFFDNDPDWQNMSKHD
jgi:hypothetical protein